MRTNIDTNEMQAPLVAVDGRIEERPAANEPEPDGREDDRGMQMLAGMIVVLAFAGILATVATVAGWVR